MENDFQEKNQDFGIISNRVAYYYKNIFNVEIVSLLYRKKNSERVKRVMQNGKMYLVELTNGYTAFGEKTRLARRIPEVGFIARIAKEEKEHNKTINDYIKEFTENGIYFDGKTIPQFIDTIEDVEKANEKKAEKAEKTEKAKTDKKTK